MRLLAEAPRTVVLLLCAIGVAALAAAVADAGAAAEIVAVAALLALAAVLYSKMLVRSRSLQAMSDDLRGEVSRLRTEAEQLARDRDRIVERLRAAEKRGTDNARQTEGSTDRIRAMEASLAALMNRIDELDSRVAAIATDTAGEMERVAGAAARAQAAVDRLRREGELLAETVATAVATTRRDLAAMSDAVYPAARSVPSRFTMAEERPTLSIAIPSFNRASELAECLESIVEEVTGARLGDVEVCITDDASTDRRAPLVAQRYTEAHDFISLHLNDENLGLERNLIRSAAPCRGRYLLLMGNDDVVAAGGLAALVDDLRGGEYSLYLYEQQRVDSQLRPIEPIPGSTPVEIAPGEARRFDSPFALAAGSGLLSTYGFISQVVMEREPFMATAPEPYLALTLYPHVGMMLEAFDGRPVLYRNQTLVLHRTTTRVEKWAEAIGRPEENYMQGGERKLGEFFGYRLAAFHERLARRTSIDRAAVAAMPERLFTDRPVADWIERNIAIGEQLQVEIPDEVVDDGAAWLSAVRDVPRQAAG